MNEAVVTYGDEKFLVKGNYTPEEGNGVDTERMGAEFEVQHVYLYDEQKTDLYFLFEKIEGAVQILGESAVEALQYT